MTDLTGKLMETGLFFHLTRAETFSTLVGIDSGSCFI